MKKIYSFFLMLFAVMSYNAQDAGIFESYIVLNINGAGNTYYDLQAATGNLDFNGADLGTFNATTQSIVFAGGEMKTYKNGGADVTGGKIHYVVYAATPGSFSNVTFSWLANLGGNDQKWGSTSGTQNILSGLADGSYTLEVYVEASTSLGSKYSSNGGTNYKATFKVSSTLGVGDIKNSNFKSFVSNGKLYTSKKGNLDIQVVDFSGRVVKTIKTQPNNDGIELNLVKKGNYLLKVENEVIKFAY